MEKYSIEKTVELVLNCEENGHNRVKPFIRKVPSAFRDSNAKFYTPRMVSIGPLHRGDEKLQPFEPQKAANVQDLLKWCCGRGGNSSSLQQTFYICFKTVTGFIHKIKEGYDETGSYTDDELAKMMVLDGCFIIYILLQLSYELMEDFLITQYIIYDLLLIENQIPFFILECIFQCIVGRPEPETSLVRLMQIFLLPYYNIFKEKLDIRNLHTNTKPCHILGLAHIMYQRDARVRLSDLELDYEIEKCHSASDLDRAGVHFQPYHDRNWTMAIKLKLHRFSWFFSWFCCKPLLQMPVVELHDFTELVLRNLIMYEEFSPVKSYVLSYVYFMDALIDTPEDVRTLKKCKVVFNFLGSDEMAATMINNIAKESPLDYFFYKNELEKLDKYYSASWPNMIAELKRKYFTNPWTIIALLAGIALFGLTVVQTLYAIKSA